MSSKHKNKNFIQKKSNLQFENKRIFIKHNNINNTHNQEKYMHNDKLLIDDMNHIRNKHILFLFSS